MSRFEIVTKTHDEFVGLIQNEIFPQYGILVEPIGYEKTMDLGFQNRLKECRSETAFFLRFNPDLGIISPNNFVALVDGKTKKPSQQSQNISIELHPWEKAKSLMKNEGINIFYVFHNFKACWVTDIMPDKIHVPKRWGVGIYWEIKRQYENVCPVKYVNWNYGQSGTIYFLLYPETISTFLGLDLFIERELLNAKE